MKKLNRLMALLLLVLPISIFAQPFVQFTAESSNVNCETNSLSIDIDITDFIDVTAWQYSFHWDPTVLTLTSLDDTGLLSNIGKNQTGAAQGDLTFSWFSGAGVTTTDGTILTLNFDLIGNASQTTEFIYDNNPTFIVIGQYGMQLNDTQYQLNTGQVTISDNVNPTISCPSSNLTFDTNGGTNTTITGAAPTTGDNCGVDFISYNLSGATSGSGTGDVNNNVAFEVGTTTVTYTVNDFGGNTATCSFDVEITNNNPITTISIYMDNLTTNCEDNTASINIYADNFTELRSTQFSIQWDPILLEYVDTSNIVFNSGFTSFGTSNISNGELGFSWGDFNPLTLPNGTVLFTINFNIVSPPSVNPIPVEFFEDPGLPTQFVSASSFPTALPPSEYQLIDGSITLTDNINPTISCPTNISINSSNGTDATVNMIAPTANDNCAVVDTSYTLSGATSGSGTGDASGTIFLVGTTTVNYTITDLGGNTATCDFQVEVTNDLSNIVSIYLDDVTNNCEDNTASINVFADNFTEIRSTQFSFRWDPALLEYVDTSNIVFNSGFTSFGISNISDGELGFSWGDFNPLTLPSGTILFTINFNIVTPLSVNPIPVEFFEDPALPTQFVSASSFPMALPPSEYQLIDGSILIIDDINPTISCPANISINSSNGTDATVNMIAPTANDNCTIVDTSYTLTGATMGSGTGDASGTIFLVGTTTVEYTITDLGGNTATCNFQVEVTNDVPGILTLYLDNLMLDCGATTASINVYADNFNEIRSTQFNIRWNTNFLEYVDTSNIIFNSGFTSFGITDIDNGELSFSWGDFNPLTLPDSSVLFTINFNINAPPGFTIPVQFFENPAIPTQFVNATSFPMAMDDSEYELIDGSIFIFDDEAPVITCPADITINTQNGMDAAVNNIAPTVTDNCGILDTTYTLSGATNGSGTGDASGTTFALGTTNVIYTVNDLDGNSSTCNFNVTIEVPPTYIMNIDSVNVSCSNDTATIGFTLENYINVTGFQFTIEWDETQLEYFSVTDNLVPMGNPGTTDVNNGIFTYSWFGSATTFTNGFQFIELKFVILNNTPGNDHDIEFVTSGAPTPLMIITQEPGGSPMSPPASQTVFNNGNVEIIDNSPPTITCPADVTVSGNGMATVPVDNIAATATDDCATPSISYVIGTVPPITGTGDASGNSFPEGTTQVTYTATDEAGNSVECSFNVTVVQDDLTIACPANINQNADAGTCGAAIGELPVTILSDPNNVATIGYEMAGATGFAMGVGNIPAMTYAVGTTTLVYTVTDNFGAIEQCTLTVIINDVEAPIFSNIPQNATVECDNIPAVVDPTASDNCDGNVPVTFIGETILPGGNTIIRQWSTTDSEGNVATVSQTLTVVDTTPPSISCPDDITLNAISSMLNVCGNNATWNQPIAFDNCDMAVSITSTHDSGDFFEVGTETVTYYAVDDAGNIDSCSFTVTILDNEAPTVTDCPTDIVISGGANCSASVTWMAPTFSDNCDDNLTINSSHQPGNFSIGTTPVTITGTDASGNTSTCTFNIIVTDNIAPTIACPAAIIVSTNGDEDDPNDFVTVTPMGCDSVILTFGTPIAADNCGVPTIVQTSGISSGETFGIGGHIIEFVATDGAGNTDTCEVNILVNPFVAITASASPDSICLGDDSQLTVNPMLTDATVTWTSPNGTITISNVLDVNNVTLADSGTYMVSVVDNVTMCSSETTVELVVLQGPDISIVANALNCTDGSIDLPLAGIINNTIAVTSWEWTNPSGTVFSTNQNAVIALAQESDSGIYCLTATGSNGCSNQVCQEITITDNLNTPPTINPNCESFLCVGETCSLNGFSTGGIDSMIWTVNDPNGGLSGDINSNQVSITPVEAGIYIYTYTVFSDGCASSTNFPLQVGTEANVLPDFIPVEFNELTEFNVTDNDQLFGSLPGTYTINVTEEVDNGTLVNNGDGTFSYTPNDSYFGTDQFIYEICLDCNDETICRWAIVTLEVTTEECLIPTVITPNGDGMNDVLEITCIDQNPENELVVYNRWGDEVYRASPYANDWKGTFNDQPLPDGTYFFIFSKDSNDSDPQKGSLTIMR